jgi:hypothetical protein
VGAQRPEQQKALELAKQHFDEGQALFLLGKFSEAAEEFQKAYEAKPFPAFIFNIAVCHEKGGEHKRALDGYLRYLEEDPQSPDRDVVLKRIANLRRLLASAASLPASQPSPAPEGALPPPLPKGIVVIESKPPGASIYLDDKRRGVFARTPFNGSLPQGEHTVIIELRKFKPETKRFHVGPRASVFLYFALSAEEYLGWIEVKANVPGADVFFDEKHIGAIGRTPYTGFLRPGPRTVYVEKPGYKPVRRPIEVIAGRDHVVKVNLEKVPFGWLRVTGKTTAGARILVDGKPISCRTAPCQAELAPGQYSVEVQRKGWKSYRERVTVRQAAETRLAVRLMPRPPRTKAYVTFGMSGALLVGGLVCGVMSQNRASSVEESNQPGRPYDSGDARLSTGRVLAITADSLFVLGGLTAGLGLYYLLRNEGPDSYGEARERQVAGDTAGPQPAAQRRPALTLMPSLGPGGAGLTGMVRF